MHKLDVTSPLRLILVPGAVSTKSDWMLFNGVKYSVISVTLADFVDLHQRLWQSSSPDSMQHGLYLKQLWYPKMLRISPQWIDGIASMEKWHLRCYLDCQLFRVIMRDRVLCSGKVRLFQYIARLRSSFQWPHPYSNLDSSIHDSFQDSNVAHSNLNIPIQMPLAPSWSSTCDVLPNPRARDAVMLFRTGGRPYGFGSRSLWRTKLLQNYVRLVSFTLGDILSSEIDSKSRIHLCDRMTSNGTARNRMKHEFEHGILSIQSSARRLCV